MSPRDKGRSPEDLYSSLADDPDLCAIVELFVEEMPARIAEFQRLLEAEDWDALRRAAHQLKGAAGSYGFSAITPAAGRVEQVIRECQPEQCILEAVQELIDLCRRARAGAPPARSFSQRDV